MPAPRGNKNALGKKVGRKPRYTEPEKMQVVIDRYFASFRGKKKYPRVCALALALGFADRKSLYEYRDKYIEFSSIIKKALTRIEDHYESMLNEGKPTGAIFALKNMGWSDKQEHEVTIRKMSFELPLREKRTND